ncbi:37S ribosomal protein S16, mitochondrial [Cystobasidiomycetes sp. EMM_F5]
MVVKMRLAPSRLVSTLPNKMFNIVIANGRRARDSKPLETLGLYDPTPRRVATVPRIQRSLIDEGKPLHMEWVKRIEWDSERIKYWLSVGAQPTKRVAWLLHKQNLIPRGKSFEGYSGPPKIKKGAKVVKQATLGNPPQQPSHTQHPAQSP